MQQHDSPYHSTTKRKQVKEQVTFRIQEPLTNTTANNCSSEIIRNKSGRARMIISIANQKKNKDNCFEIKRRKTEIFKENDNNIMKKN